MRFLSLHSVSSVPPNSKVNRASVVDRDFPRSRYGVFAGLATIGCAADLLTKHWVFQWRGLPRENNEWWLWEPYIGIETAVNPGALFGVGGGYGHVFAVLSILAAIGIGTWLFWFGAAKDRWLTVALGLVLGGILGNLYDRLGLWVQPDYPLAWKSGVRDWILFRYGQYTWPNFNIADSLLVCGAVMLMLHAYWEQPEQKAETTADP